MGREIGQESRHQPAVLWDGSLLHMVFSSNGGDNRILYATSPDGLKWTPGSDTGQTSGAARPSPIHKGGLGTEWNLLVLVFVANPPTKLAGLAEYNRVSKRIGSIYRRGRSPHWIKVKTPTRPPSRARLRRIGTGKNCRRRGGPMLNSMGVQHDRPAGDLRNKNGRSAGNGRTWHEAAAERQCGDCSMCCKVMRVEEISKPEHQWWQHARPGIGCAIYETRPAKCRVFRCGWLVLDMRPHWKPTKCKMVLVRRRDRQSGGRELIVQPDRNYPNAWRRSPYYEELKAQCGQIRIQIIVSDRCNVMMCPDQDVYFGPNTEAVMFDGVGRVKGVLPIEEARKYILDSN